MARQWIRLFATLLCVLMINLAIGTLPDASNASIADDAPAAPEEAALDYDEYVTQRPFQVGYRRMEFELDLVDGSSDGRQLDVWYPTDAREQRHNYFGQNGFAAVDAEVAEGRHPLLVFSHGFLGASDQSIFLTEACARAGYIVIAMNHQDAFFNRRERGLDDPEFLNAASWDDTKYRDRRADVVQLLDWFLEQNQTEGSDWEGRIDVDHIGAMGHSLGGYTVLGLSGGWPSWRDERIRAAVVFAPFAAPYTHNGDLEGVTIPVMIQGATLDFGITPFLPAVYQELGGSKAYLVLSNETHFGWTNIIALGMTTTEAVESGNADLMVRYTIAWFDHYLLGVDCNDVLRADEPSLDSYFRHE